MDWGSVQKFTFTIFVTMTQYPDSISNLKNMGCFRISLMNSGGGTLYAVHDLVK